MSVTNKSNIPTTSCCLNSKTGFYPQVPVKQRIKIENHTKTLTSELPNLPIVNSNLADAIARVRQMYGQ